MTVILALDATSQACSAAVWSTATDHEASGTVVGRYEIAPREHTRKLLPMVRAVLAEAGLALHDVDAVAFGRGPGAFTGIRIAAGIAQGLAVGLDCPMIAVSSLEALALGAALQHDDASQYALGVLDARMGEIYIGGYQVVLSPRDFPQLIPWLPEQVCAPDAISLPAVIPLRVIAAGAGVAFHQAYPEALRQAIIAQDVAAEPDARCIARLAAYAYSRGETVVPEAAQPVYLRDNVATPTTRRPLA